MEICFLETCNVSVLYSSCAHYALFSLMYARAGDAASSRWSDCYVGSVSVAMSTRFWEEMRRDYVYLHVYWHAR